MTTIVYSEDLDPNVLLHDSMAIRLATLLGGDFFVAGSPADIMHNKRMLENMRGNINAMLSMLHRMAKSEKDRAQMEEVMALLKDMKKVKHPDKRQIVMQQQVIRATAGLFQFFIEDTYHLTQTRTGLPSLEPLIDEDFTGFYNVDLQGGLLNSGQEQLSSLFWSSLQANPGPLLPMVGGARLAYIKEHGAHHVQLQDNTTLYMLEFEHLLTLRNDLTIQGQACCTALDELWNTCAADQGPDCPQQAVHDLQQQVAPAMRTFLQALSHHPLHASLSPSDTGLRIAHLGVGLCPFEVYITAFREAKMIDDRTWQQLQGPPPEGITVPRWVPYIAVDFEALVHVEEQDGSFRKTLDID
jgi:hypothetical protein